MRVLTCFVSGAILASVTTPAAASCVETSIHSHQFTLGAFADLRTERPYCLPEAQGEKGSTATILLALSGQKSPDREASSAPAMTPVSFRSSFASECAP